MSRPTRVCASGQSVRSRTCTASRSTRPQASHGKAHSAAPTEIGLNRINERGHRTCIAEVEFMRVPSAKRFGGMEGRFPLCPSRRGGSRMSADKLRKKPGGSLHRRPVKVPTDKRSCKQVVETSASRQRVHVNASAPVARKGIGCCCSCRNRRKPEKEPAVSKLWHGVHVRCSE